MGRLGIAVTVLEVSVAIMGVLQPVLLGLLIRALGRLTAIEVALGLRDSPDAREGRDLQVQAQARKVCREPHVCHYGEHSGVHSPSNPRLPAFDPDAIR